ncbi:MAG: hypothetical protein IJE97_09320, partial [Thermoguttaceae bacterium]|nr:hypothetical protein [Thermoguttaceae bacterium]
SISTTAPLTPVDDQNAQTTQIAQNANDEQSAQTTQIAQNANVIGPQLPTPPQFDIETAFRQVDLLVDLENCVAKFFAPLAPIYETAPSPFQIAEAEELYAAAPSPSDLAADEEFDENDDFAFASSGSPTPAQAPEPAATIGGFGAYQAPTFDALAATAPPQNAQTAQVPFVPQNAQTAQAPFVPQNAQTAQVPFVPQNAQTAQVPSVPQNVQTAQVPSVPPNVQTAQVPPVSQYAAPQTTARRPSTPEERLQAAIAAGAEVREISPEEYRRAVSVGMSGQTPSR